MLIVLGLAACKKDSETTNVVNTSNNLLSCKINGNSWSATTRAAVCYHDVSEHEYSGFGITGINPTNLYDTLLITISGATPKTYTESEFTVAIIDDNSNIYTLTQGTLTITSVDTTNKKFSGTFNFEVKAENSQTTIQVTDGNFNLNYYVLDY